MPRKSAASLSVVSVGANRPSLTPRTGLTAECRAIFHELTAQVPADHFRPSDAALIEQYAQAVALSRQAYAMLETEGPVIAGRANPWVIVLEKAHRSSVALSTRLRLSPQHRTDPKTVGRAKHSASAYDLMGDDR